MDGQNIIADTTPNGLISARYYHGTSLIAWRSDGYFKFYLFNAHDEWLDLISDISKELDLDYDLGVAFILHEIGRDPDAVNTAFSNPSQQATGLMQVIPQ